MIGIVGLGGTEQNLAQQVAAFGMQIIAIYRPSHFSRGIWREIDSAKGGE